MSTPPSLPERQDRDVGDLAQPVDRRGGRRRRRTATELSEPPSRRTFASERRAGMGVDDDAQRLLVGEPAAVAER
jgi:hypothetical protein